MKTYPLLTRGGITTTEWWCWRGTQPWTCGDDAVLDKRQVSQQSREPTQRTERWTQGCGSLRLPVNEGEAPDGSLATLWRRQTQLHHSTISCQLTCSWHSGDNIRKRSKLLKPISPSVALLLRERSLLYGPPEIYLVSKWQEHLRIHSGYTASHK